MKLANVSLVFLLLVLLAANFGESQWFLDLFSHFMFHYALAALLLGIYFWMKKAKRQVWVAAGALLVAVFFLAEAAGRRAPPVMIPRESERIRIFEFNSSGRLEILKNWLPVHAAQYDVLVLLEAHPEYQELLEQLKGEFPHQVAHLENSPFGIAVLSRWEITESKEFETEGGSFPQYEIKIKRPVGDEFLLYALHAPPPFAPQLADAHEAILGELREKLHHKSHPAIVVGDLNTTTTSFRMAQLMRGTGLRDTVGFAPGASSWPAIVAKYLPFLGIRIDHCLVSNSFTLVEREVLTDLGSNHLPLRCVVQIEK